MKLYRKRGLFENRGFGISWTKKTGSNSFPAGIGKVESRR
jgi:hypothetical protein